MTTPRVLEEQCEWTAADVADEEQWTERFTNVELGVGEALGPVVLVGDVARRPLALLLEDPGRRHIAQRTAAPSG